MRPPRTPAQNAMYFLAACILLGCALLISYSIDSWRQQQLIDKLRDELERVPEAEPPETGEVEIPRPAQLMVLFPIHWEDFRRFSSAFGERDDPLSPSAGGENVEDHGGLDVVPLDTVWNARVRPAAPGEVTIHWPPKGRPVPGYPDLTFTGDDKRGAWIEILHDTGWRSRYLHLSWTNPDVVHEGARVGVEDVIGRVGGSGLTTGSHLHFELINPLGKRVNPLLYFKQPEEDT